MSMFDWSQTHGQAPINQTNRRQELSWGREIALGSSWLPNWPEPLPLYQLGDLYTFFGSKEPGVEYEPGFHTPPFAITGTPN